MKGKGAAIGPANKAMFCDKEWLTVDNNPGSPFYGRAYLVAARFLNALHGGYAESPIYFAYSDDGGRTWSKPKEISGSNPLCTDQSDRAAGECDEDRFPIPEVAPERRPDRPLPEQPTSRRPGRPRASSIDAARSEVDRRWRDVRRTRSSIAQLEDGAADTPWSVIGRQTVTGPPDPLAVAGQHHRQTRPTRRTGWWSTTTTSPAPTTPAPAELPRRDPAVRHRTTTRATPPTNTNVYLAESWNGGATWAPRIAVDTAAGDQWFPWADFRSDGIAGGRLRLQREHRRPRRRPGRHLQPRAADDRAAHPVGGRWPSWPRGAGAQRRRRSAAEQVDISVTHWAGQYVPQAAWPTICGPDGYTDPPITDAEGKDCNVFHGDYTGLAVGSGRQHQRRLDRTQQVRDLAADRPLHRRTPRRLRPGRDVRTEVVDMKSPIPEPVRGLVRR